MAVKARLVSVEKEPGETFTAKLALELKGSEYILRLCKLAREPSSIKVEDKGEFIVIELIDANGKGFASCPIHRSHVDSECLDCPSLLIPKKNIEDKS